MEGTLYSYGGGYSLAEELIPGYSYWLMFEGNTDFQISGTAIHSIEIQLSEGWNLISGISNAVNVEEIIDPENLMIPGTVYGFQ